VPLTREGVMPFLRYFVRKKGMIEVGTTSCASCHTRVLPDGSVVNGTQATFRFMAGFKHDGRGHRPGRRA
jgi:hypothetical protein